MEGIPGLFNALVENPPSREEGFTGPTFFPALVKHPLSCKEGLFTNAFSIIKVSRSTIVGPPSINPIA